MRYFAILAVLVGLAGFFLGAFFYREFILPKIAIQPPAATSTPLAAAPAPSATTTPQPTATTGFRGPTSQPHIIGPKGPPPSY